MASLNALCSVMQQQQDPAVEALKAKLAKKQLEIERARMEAEDKGGQMVRMRDNLNDYLAFIQEELELAQEALRADRDRPLISKDVALNTADSNLTTVLHFFDTDMEEIWLGGATA